MGGAAHPDLQRVRRGLPNQRDDFLGLDP
jgi:hypothetical protein